MNGFKMSIFNGIKKLGFGLMRLPIKGGVIDSEEFELMVENFISSGYTYFDTAPGYMNGYSESYFKRFVADIYPRGLFQIATKLPAWDLSRINSSQDVVKVFNNSLRNTGVDFFDYYLLHNIGGERTILFDRYKVWDFVFDCKKKGLINYYGISFHGKSNELETIINKHPDIDFVQLQINYADWNDKQVESKKCYNVATAHNKPIIVMEPLKGGTLFNLPESYLSELTKVSNMSPAKWAFRWLESLPQINIVLSGMSSIKQIKENTTFFNNILPLNLLEKKAIEKVQSKLAAATIVSCTGCMYCRSICPKNIPIDHILTSLNIFQTFKNFSAAYNKYSFQTRDGNFASTCLKCKKCETICPQHIHISDFIHKASILFDK